MFIRKYIRIVYTHIHTYCLFALPEHLSSSSVFSGVRVSFMCMFCRSLFVFSVIALYVLLRFRDSDYLPLLSSNSSSTFPLISTKQTNTYFLKLSNTKQSIWYGVENPGTGSRQAQGCDEVKPVNGIPYLFPFKCLTTIQI